MTSTSLSTKFLALLLFTASLALGSAAHSKIGGPLTTFQTKNAKLFTLKSRSVKEDKVYYVYSLTSHPAQQHSSPGFAGGVTLTTSGGKILGESLVIRLGADQEVGRILAAAICMELTYEAIGKAAPKTESLRAFEFNSYTNAITRGMQGMPQTIRYKNCNMRITISRTDENNLLLAITPIQPAAAKPDPTAAH